MMIFLLSALAKVTLILLIGLGVASLLRTASAAVRHLVWAATVAATALTLPLALLLPPLAVPVDLGPGVAPPVAGEQQVVTDTPGAMRDDAGSQAATTHAVVPTTGRPAAPRMSVWTALVWVWVVGMAAVLGRVLLGHLGVAALVRRSAPLSGPRWSRLLASIGGGDRVCLLKSPRVGSPMIWGVRRPVVLLPADADAWPDARAAAVLTHEVAHARRMDCATQALADLACAAYWFHPLVWTAARRLRAESERACDDAVLAAGAAGSDYATHLLDVARGARTLRLTGTAAIGMARPSQLEGRLLAVLDPARARRALGARAQAAALVASLALVLPLAAARPIDAAQAKADGITRPDLTASNARDLGLNLSASLSLSVDTIIERSLKARSGETLTLDLATGGQVEIVGWDEPRVLVRAELRGPQWRETDLDIRQGSDGVHVAARLRTQRMTTSSSHIFEIRVPRRYDVRLESAGGGVSITGVDGDFTGTTGGGALILAQLTGHAELRTGGGAISVADSDLEGSVRSGGGQVLLSGVSSSLRASSGSGPVIGSAGVSQTTTGRLRGVSVVGDRVMNVDPSTGRLSITEAGGNIDLDKAPNGATIETGGGDLRITRAGGPVRAVTGGGSITLGSVAGSVEARSGNGPVRIRIEGDQGDDRAVDVITYGDVILDLPAGLSMRFDLETAFTDNADRPTRIVSDWDLRQETTAEWDTSRGTPRRYVRASGTISDVTGPRSLIRVRTVNGDITIRRH